MDNYLYSRANELERKFQEFDLKIKSLESQIEELLFRVRTLEMKTKDEKR